MLRRLNPEMTLGALLATVFWVAILGWQAAYSPTEIEKQECEETAKKTGHKTEECKTFWERTTSDPVALFTGLLFVSTVGLWGATVGLYLAGERQIRLIASISRQTDASVNLARDEFIASHRPIMKVKLVNLVEIDDECAGVQFTVVNMGQTTAHIVGSCAMADFFSETNWPHPNDYGINNVIPPRRFVNGATDTYTIGTADPIGFMTVHAGEAEAALQLRFYGYIVYRDDLDNVRTTYFCRRYNPRWDRFDPAERTDYDSAD